MTHGDAHYFLSAASTETPTVAIRFIVLFELFVVIRGSPRDL